MSAPTTSELFNQITPAAPTGDQNVTFVSDGGTPLQQITAYPKKATASLRGVVKPDGTTITVASDGTISAVAPPLLVASTIRGALSLNFPSGGGANLPVTPAQVVGTGAQVGDLAIVLASAGISGSPPAISGWTAFSGFPATGTTWQGVCQWKVLNSSDISSGFTAVQPGFINHNGNGVLDLVVLVGNPTVRETHLINGGPGGGTMTTSSAVLSTDVGIVLCTNSSTTVETITPSGTVETTTSGNGAAGAIQLNALPAGASNIVVSTAGGEVACLVVLEAQSVPNGTVSSVGLSMPSDFTVTGSPVTSSGTLTVTANTQSANMVKAGPASGSPAAPTYRAIVSADLPAATTSALGAVKPDGSSITISSGVISASAGGISLTTLGSGAATLTGGVLNIPTPSGGGGGGGAGAGTPFRFVQENLFGTNSNITSFTMTFPQALASSGNTAFILISCDGSQAVTMPSGWTVDFNQQQNTYARLILLHKTSAGDTSATFSIGSGSSFSAYFCEIAGSHALDQSALGGSNSVTPIQTGTITPTANSLLIVAAGIVTNSSGTQGVSAGIINQANYTTFTIGSTAPGGRALCVAAARNPAANVATIPPALYLSGYSLFSGGGIAYAAFSIL